MARSRLEEMYWIWVGPACCWLQMVKLREKFHTVYSATAYSNYCATCSLHSCYGTSPASPHGAYSL